MFRPALVICGVALAWAACASEGAGARPATTTAATVQRWDTTEIALLSRRGYENPFRDVILSAKFTHGSGREVTVGGFFDGSGVWRVRFMPTEVGRWTWRTTSNDLELDGRTGAVTAIPPTSPYLHGPLRADGLNFIHADGTRRYLVSTRLSCQYAKDSVIAGTIPLLQRGHINRVLFMMPGVQGQTKLLFAADGNDPSRFEVARFAAMDRFIDALRRADIQASPYLYYFNDRHLRRLTPEQDQAYIRYTMARIGAYANVMPVLANEVEQRFADRAGSYDLRGHEWANRNGGLLRGLAVFGVPVTVHNPMENFEARSPGFFTLLKEWPFPWADYMLRQMQVGALGSAESLAEDTPEPTGPAYSARAFARHNQLLIDLRRHHVPIINEEPGYEMDGTFSWNSQSPSTVRQTFWTAALAGAHAMWGNPATYETENPIPLLETSRVPGYLAVLAAVMDSVPYWSMQPANDLVGDNPETVGGAAYRTTFALARPGHEYLVYSRKGGPVLLRVEPGKYVVTVIPSMGNAIPDGPPPVPRPARTFDVTDGPLEMGLRGGVDAAVIVKRVP